MFPYNDGDQTLIRIEESIFSGTFNIYLAIRNRYRNTLAIAQPITMETQQSPDAAYLVREPTLQIAIEDKECLIDLMDDLWNMGIRPTNIRYKDDTLQATNRHLDDLRTIAFHKLGIKEERK